MSSRDGNFTDAQKMEIYDGNAWWTLRQHGFQDKRVRWSCDSCEFTSKHKWLFHIDHVQPVAGGGDNDRAARDPDVRAVMREEPMTGLQQGHSANGQVLCEGCNLAKKDKPFVPTGAGYAYRFPDLDENPRHAYQGGPDDMDHRDVRREVRDREKRLGPTKAVRFARDPRGPARRRLESIKKLQAARDKKLQADRSEEPAPPRK